MAVHSYKSTEYLSFTDEKTGEVTGASTPFNYPEGAFYTEEDKQEQKTKSVFIKVLDALDKVNNDTDIQIILMIMLNPSITQVQIAKSLGITRMAVNNRYARLRKKHPILYHKFMNKRYKTNVLL